jgi:hypothetical protein
MEGMGVKEGRSVEAGNVALAARLRHRSGEMKSALAHLFATRDPSGVRDPERALALEAAFAAVTAYNVDCIERGEGSLDPLPREATAQARSAAREGTALEDFVLGVIAAQSRLSEFVLQESRELSDAEFASVQALQGSILLCLASGLADEYKREQARLRQSAARRQTALVDRLLAGAPIAPSEVGYALDGWHLGMVVSGSRAADAARTVAELLGAALLAAPRESGTVWAWLGGRRRIPSQLVEDLVRKRRGLGARFALGEPGHSLEGWRSTHFEARAALAVAIRSAEKVTCFSRVGLEAMALQTPDLARSLRAAYLDPLAGSRGRGEVLRRTLRAYFAAGRNASSAASALGVTRRTVENRLRLVERELGRPLDTCGAELELALRLEALDGELTDLLSS